MEVGPIFGVDTETSHSLSAGKVEGSLWGYIMSALMANMTVLQDTFLISHVILLATPVCLYLPSLISTRPGYVPDVASTNANKTF